jgi:ATP-dependent Clp protease ATP-binding subunit ClpC
LSEYRKYFEKDAALARRFQPVMVEEPSPEETLEILTGLREHYEKHHNVQIASSALRAAVELACRYLPDRRLPDKALDLLDEGCVRARIGTASFRAGEEALTAPVPVSVETVALVVSEWTGIPPARLSVAEQEKFQHMAETLSKRVIGQAPAIEQVTRIVTMSRGGLRDPKKPVGVFLFVGPTGVGKTELCRALAEFLFGSDQDMIRLDMSEYKEKHTVSRLIGAPPGYLGHDEEGQLTGKLRRKPYSVVLLDEIDKAHPEVCDLFLQLFDEGRLTDSHGRTVDGKNAIFIMTSNAAVSVSPAGAKPIGFAVAEPDAAPLGSADQRQALRNELRHSFRAEFLNRIDEIVLFRQLSLADLGTIARQMLGQVAGRLLARSVIFEFEDGAVEAIAKAGYDPADGARPLARVIDRVVSGPLSQKLMAGEIQPGDHIVAVARNGAIEFTKVPVEEDSEQTR